ncbi:hypothetical protein AAD018_010830 [Aestuariibius insulae]|uniref:hypothetical protein n=1 Tax=Aestuariibius insulae TaxID=2058287 RepID=UPI00345E33A8
MTVLDHDTFLTCMAEASLAPTVHNTQPARWGLSPDGTITLHCAPGAALPVADPSNHDLILSCGTALEGMVIALAGEGHAAQVTPLGTQITEPLARITLGGYAEPDPLASAVSARLTYRRPFAPADPGQFQALTTWAATDPDIHLITTRSRITEIAAQNDALSHRLLQNPAFRKELLSWTRLSKCHPDWSRNGLNADALGLPRWQAAFMGAFFKVFSPLDRLGLATGFTAEKDDTETAAAIAFLAVPKDLPALDAGRRYYRATLKLAASGFASWPMSVLVDDPDSEAAFLTEFRLTDHRLIAALRLGPIPKSPPERARLPITETAITPDLHP